MIVGVPKETFPGERRVALVPMSVRALTKNGVTLVEAMGQPFDPALHEAMAQAPDGSVQPNTVIEELQKGYKLRDRLVRPSRVIVARAPEGDEPEAPAEAAGAEEAGE